MLGTVATVEGERIALVPRTICFHADTQLTVYQGQQIRRNVVVAETDADAERIAVPAFTAMIEHRAAMRERERRARAR